MATEVLHRMDRREGGNRTYATVDDEAGGGGGAGEEKVVEGERGEAMLRSSTIQVAQRRAREAEWAVCRV
jgi:hypothetical protein